MLSWQEEQEERRRILREQDRPSTFNQFAQSDADVPHDRFHQVNAGTVVGAKSDIAALYPAASSAHQTQLPPEPPLGYSVEKDHKLMGGGRA